MRIMLHVYSFFVNRRLNSPLITIGERLRNVPVAWRLFLEAVLNITFPFVTFSITAGGGTESIFTLKIPTIYR